MARGPIPAVAGVPFMASPAPRRRGRSRWKRWVPVVVGLVLLALAPILAHAQEPDSVVVTWTAPGDDGHAGRATAYDLRYSESQIDASNFDAASPVGGLPAPAANGARQSVTVRDLTHGTVYFFAIRAVDDAGNWSPISNVLRWDWTLDTAPPSAPSGGGAESHDGTILVTWQPNTEADLAGYRVYRATQATGPWTALNSTPIVGTEFVDTDVPDAPMVWYQVAAVDASGNESAHSGTISVALQSLTTAAAIEPGYPNPSRASSIVHIPVTLPSGGTTHAVVDVLDSGGRRVRRIEIVDLSPGRQEVQWDGTNDAGREVAPGVYRAWLIAGSSRSSIRLVRVP
jgi:hypothetical protein